MTDHYRNGRHRPNHVYRIAEGPGTSFADDVEIGAMFTDDAGILVVRALNHYIRCATTPIKAGLGFAEGDPREAERQRRRELAAEQANKLGRSIVCQAEDLRSHQRCLGLRATGMNNGFGCLCECHDGQPADSNDPATVEKEATA